MKLIDMKEYIHVGVGVFVLCLEASVVALKSRETLTTALLVVGGFVFSYSFVAGLQSSRWRRFLRSIGKLGAGKLRVALLNVSL